MNLSNIHKPVGSNPKRKRVGRGMGSGMGKTSTKGHKGQKSRSGYSSPMRGFEGGQMPLIRRIPKRGFNNTRHGWALHAVNLIALNEFADGAKVDPAALKAAGLANGRFDGIKILAGGELTRKLSVSAHAFSAAAKAQIEAKGGSVELIPLIKPQPARGSAKAKAAAKQPAAKK